MTKTTPPNCKEDTCTWNDLPPPANSQECIGCEGNKNPDWIPYGPTEKP